MSVLIKCLDWYDDSKYGWMWHTWLNVVCQQYSDEMEVFKGDH